MTTEQQAAWDRYDAALREYERANEIHMKTSFWYCSGVDLALLTAETKLTAAREAYEAIVQAGKERAA